MGRVIKPGEPLFLEEDTEAVLEWQREQALLCPGCGLPRDETMRKDRQDDHYHSRRFRCHACATRDREASAFSKAVARDQADGAGIFFSIEEPN